MAKDLPEYRKKAGVEKVYAQEGDIPRMWPFR